MARIVAEIPASEFPESLVHLLPGGGLKPGTRYRVIVEEIDANGHPPIRTGYGPALGGVATGLADAEAGRLLTEEALFARLLAKHPVSAS